MACELSKICILNQEIEWRSPFGTMTFSRGYFLCFGHTHFLTMGKFSILVRLIQNFDLMARRLSKHIHFDSRNWLVKSIWYSGHAHYLMQGNYQILRFSDLLQRLFWKFWSCPFLTTPFLIIMKFLVYARLKNSKLNAHDSILKIARSRMQKYLGPFGVIQRPSWYFQKLLNAQKSLECSKDHIAKSAFPQNYPNHPQQCPLECPKNPIQIALHPSEYPRAACKCIQYSIYLTVSHSPLQVSQMPIKVPRVCYRPPTLSWTPSNLSSVADILL